MARDWNDEFEALRISRGLLHNRDYLDFLVQRVWRIDQERLRIVDFGCGFGWVGLVLLPLLAKGSEYVGIDLAGTLLAKARMAFSNESRAGVFVRGDVRSTPFRARSFDVAIGHSVLMHVPEPESALREMIRITRLGGLVICCETNRNAVNAMLSIAEVNETDAAPLSMFQAVNGRIRAQRGTDYNLGMRLPAIMHRLGLRDVQARTTDAVRLLFPPLETSENEELFQAMCSEGLGLPLSDDESRRRLAQFLIDHGIEPEAARIEAGREANRDFAGKGRGYHTAQASVMTFSFGRVRE
jgi:SAM-dependent methyltransferase